MPGMTERKRYMREETTTARGDYEPDMGKVKKKAAKKPQDQEPDMGKVKKKAAKKPQDQEPDMGKAKKKYRRP